MNYLVVLHAQSAVGRIYAAGNHDGLVTDGELFHPALVCSEIATDRPNYIFARRPMKEAESHQSLYLPHGSVVEIVEFGKDAPAPFGFVSSDG